ncbi:class I SAM-dependent methyltransferase [Rubrivirga sp. S365]|uniref:class I SAM-dependent methyltransferase n=1 Tax=Rubrivirga sp. S365 TaxID=3076080 RepID=UPI0028C832E4|nr:class I SAM-dependent methyltransferase [Rubrivirga sp. S365]MDT7858162.1 class I SAM-dependent methyltransferase [Rubrivirga sp. S365]
MSPPHDDGAYWSANYQKHVQGGALYRWFLDRVHDDVHRLVMEFGPASLLDAGCGEGFVAAALKRREPTLEINGVDADPAAVAYAQVRHGRAGSFSIGDLYGLPFDDGSFDVVLCSEVLEHLEDPARALAELVRVARSGVVLTVPREPYFDWLSRLGRALGTAPDPGHVHHWTPRSFAAFLSPHLGPVTVQTQHIFALAAAPVRPPRPAAS